MVKFLKRAYSLDRLMHCRGKVKQYEKAAASGSFADDNMLSKAHYLEDQMMSSRLHHCPDKPPKPRFNRNGDAKVHHHPSDMDLMKERFSKLLLGEDMSGGGIGVSSALALSNAITNLAASVFGEQRRLEPMSAEVKERWRREIDWLLSVTDHIVEFVPSKQVSKDGITMEIMVTQQRKDLRLHLPALRKLDAVLIEYLDTFKDQNEFCYVSSKDGGDESGEGNNARREDDKWWLPTVKVPPNGLSEASRGWLLYQKELVNQVLKAAMAINAHILMEMEIPESYIEALPKNGRASLGDSLYRSITDDEFDPEEFFSSVDLSTEHKILDIKNRIEASIIIWRRKMNNKDSKSPWGSADVGHSILESYSRIIESLAFTVISRIEDVLHADSLVQDKASGRSRRRPSLTDDSEPVKALDPKEEIEKLSKIDTSHLMTLQDFMGWQLKGRGNGTATRKEKDEDPKWMKKLSKLVTNKRFSYIEKIESQRSSRSPTYRH
ncbi:rho guanine nucleotide exchange factor 8-like [Canna indica]|uniref:Rho guanine nucleotide exchange factor 8-like n=1 Tax=Canna indica TaxID=4628 RepID=A0AAQ3QMT6_9LILI|nr:rho guanine nucleotide exchange factor 8-like [Canna indica]